MKPVIFVTSKDSLLRFMGKEFTCNGRDTGVVLIAKRQTSIINECITNDCGENVGASSNPSAAPEVAASDEDGDGDGEDDPDRRPKRRPRNAIPPAAEHFDRLPDSAHIDLCALRAITGKSRATLYRWMDRGLLPKPRKLGPTHNFWTAGEIRRALSA